MNRLFAAAAFSAALMAAPALASSAPAQGSSLVREGAAQMASVKAVPSELAASALDLRAQARGNEGSLFGPIKLSSSPSVCAVGAEQGAVHYYYSAAMPEPALPLCNSDGLQAQDLDHVLPVHILADAALEDAAPLDDPGLPDIPLVVNKSVESFIRYFQTSGRKYFEKWLGRSADYMGMLQAILRENGLPEDLSYIALIESGLNPTVRSRANAVGMWQFIKGTAQKYDLRVDWWIDERMDPEKATHAAARYLKNLYGMFGSWYLAAAGYNGGEGRVARAIKSHGTDDFWELASQKKPLYRETREYVPKYLAALAIAKDPELYGFNAVEFNHVRRYDKVKVAQATDLRVIAEASGTTVEEIRKLNPELLRWFTPPNYPGYEIKIPAGKAAAFRANMSKVPAARRVAFLQHKVRRGETLSTIARRYGTGVQPIAYLNNNINSKRLKAGMVLVIPVRASDAPKKGGKTVAEVVTRMELQS